VNGELNYVVYDRDNQPVNRSRNLRGVRDYVRHNSVKSVHLQSKKDGGGILNLRFDNGATYSAPFADFGVLKNWVRRWRGVYGSNLRVDMLPAGVVEKMNPVLIGGTV